MSPNMFSVGSTSNSQGRRMRSSATASTYCASKAMAGCRVASSAKIARIQAKARNTLALSTSVTRRFGLCAASRNANRARPSQTGRVRRSVSSA